ncbi:hypothetical protein EYC84_004263 [Monilinia fructicola]|uniref:Uncharacterized protein n=1 Tax=Monilinia fructicola TaxID=38448 RepID=A0A5M9K2M8_MONFR|nr:hypothetical protein EYC84_004263 [Monilinia fructicola]
MAPAWLSSPIMTRKWRFPKVIIWLNVIELAGTVAALVLYRFYMLMRIIDHCQRFHLFGVKHCKVFNIGISVLSMFIQLCKVVMFIMHIWYPLISTIVNGLLTACWAVSMYGQAGPDHSDPRYPSNVAWYIAKSCSYAKSAGNYHYCLMAKGTFAVSTFMMVIYLANTILGVHSLIPSRLERSVNALDLEDNIESATKAGKRVKTADSPDSERPWNAKYAAKYRSFQTTVHNRERWHLNLWTDSYHCGLPRHRDLRKDHCCQGKERHIHEFFVAGSFYKLVGWGRDWIEENYG